MIDVTEDRPRRAVRSLWLQSGTGTVPPVAPQSGRPGVDAVLRAVPLSRMLDYGASLADARQIIAQVVAGAEWVEVGLELADRHRTDAATADALDLPAVAAGHRGAAATLGLLAQLGLDGDETRRAAIYARATADFEHGPGGWQRVVVQRGNRTLVAWVGRPPGPVVSATLIWGGTSGWGPVYARSAIPLARAGSAVVLVELPGQGQPRLISDSVLRLDFIGVVDALLDDLVARFGSATRFAVVGHSMGGLLATRAAAALSRLEACVVNGGVADPAEIVRMHPRQRRQWALMLGTDSDEELIGVLESLRLDPAVVRLDCPLLVLHGALDPLVTDGDVDAFVATLRADAAPSSLVVRAPDGEHCLYNRASERDILVVEWLSQTLHEDL